LLRSPWFWIAVVLIAVGIALTVALGGLYWLLGTFAAVILVLLITLLVAAYAVGQAKPSQVPQLEAVPYSKRTAVLYDCDVTMGRPLQDVGSGLALLYLLGEPGVDLLGVTTTYGNGPTRVTTHTARRLLDSVARLAPRYDDLSVLPGATSPDDPPEKNQAARYLVDTVGTKPGEIALVATGSMTNLKHALALDPDFFDKLRGLYLLGGVTGPLTWNGHLLGERNFSLDPEAAYAAIHATCPVTIVAGQAGLTAVFRGPQLAALQRLGDPATRLIARQIRPWFALMRLWFRDGGFAMWDPIVALALTHLELLECEPVYITSTLDELRAGRLFADPSPYGPVRLVRAVQDFDGFVQALLAAWHHLGRNEPSNLPPQGGGDSQGWRRYQEDLCSSPRPRGRTSPPQAGGTEGGQPSLPATPGEGNSY